MPRIDSVGYVFYTVGMLLVTHIIFATLGIVLGIGGLISGLTKARFVQTFLRGSILGTFGTIASGTVLVLSSHTPITPACLAGLAYLGIIAALYTATKKVTATQKAE